MRRVSEFNAEGEREEGIDTDREKEREKRVIVSSCEMRWSRLAENEVDLRHF